MITNFVLNVLLQGKLPPVLSLVTKVHETQSYLPSIVKTRTLTVFLIISIVENRLSYNYDFSTLEPECCYQARELPVSVNQGKPDSAQALAPAARHDSDSVKTTEPILTQIQSVSCFGRT